MAAGETGRDLEIFASDFRQQSQLPNK